MDKIKVVGYGRVSTNDQKNSYATQRSYFEREIGKNPEYDLVHFYADEGLSGTSVRRRKNLLQLMSDAGVDHEIKKGKVTFYPSHREPNFKYVFVSNVSRFSRDTLIMDAVHELLRKKVYINFIEGGLTTEKEADLKYIELYFWIAKQESSAKSERVRFGLAETAKQGRLFENGKLYGYDYIVGENELVIKEDEAAVIRLIYSLYTVGIEGDKYGIRRIINHLTDNKMFTRDGKPFSPSSIKRMLTNEKYAGILVRNKYDSGIVFQKRSYPKIRPEDEWEVHEGKVPAIINVETFELAQKIRDNKSHSVNQRGIYKGISDLAGLLKCHHCGANYVRNIDRGRIFYNCATKKSKGVKACDALNISLLEIEEAITYFAEGGVQETIFGMREDYIEHLMKIGEVLTAKIDNQAHEEAESVIKQITDEEMKKDKLLDLFLSDVFDKSTLEDKTNEINESINNLQKQVDNLTKSNKDIRIELDQINNSIRSLDKDVKIKNKYTRSELLELIERVTLLSFRETHDSKTGDITLNKGIMMQFNFKLFEFINSIVEKYEGMENLYINKDISYRIDK